MVNPARRAWLERAQRSLDDIRGALEREPAFRRGDPIDASVTKEHGS